ncbi:MAG: hypothetical protein LBS62_13595 [Clostridiales bacterium]|nr:hypothetical protein [Clostridiales bacterium]
MTTLSELNTLYPLLPDQHDSEDGNSYKYIDILLTQYPDRTSKLLRFITGSYFTHASIGISDSAGIFYSLVTKGFRLEEPYKHPTFKGKEVPCRLYRLQVSERVYESIKRTLEYHVRQSKNYKYSYIGVLLCVLRISLKRENRYFCSQFVSEVLEYAKAAKLNKRSTLYLPDDFMQVSELALHFNGTLKDLITARTAFVY